MGASSSSHLRQDGPEALVVEVDVAVVAVGLPADEAEVLDRPFELLDRRVHVPDGEGAVARVTVRMGGDGRGEGVVGFLGQLDALAGLEALDARRRERDHRKVDARLVHQLEPGLTQLEELVDDHVPVGLARPGKVVEPPVLAHRVVAELREVLVGVERVHPALGGEVDFEVDLLHLAVPCVEGCGRGKADDARIPTDELLAPETRGYTLIVITARGARQ